MCRRCALAAVTPHGRGSAAVGEGGAVRGACFTGRSRTRRALLRASAVVSGKRPPQALKRHTFLLHGQCCIRGRTLSTYNVTVDFFGDSVCS